MLLFSSLTYSLGVPNIPSIFPVTEANYVLQTSCSQKQIGKIADWKGYRGVNKEGIL
jgi:hypothetical protein